MTDPYAVLGVSESATDDEIKSAYRKLAKQYHPDLHPGDEACAQKMNEINAAYEAIKNPEARRKTRASSSQSSQSGYGPYGYGGYGAYGSYGRSAGYDRWQGNEMQAAQHFIQAGAYTQALHVLSSVPASERTARWYYYSAQANYGAGNRVAAMEHIHRALQMEPDNPDFEELYQVIQTGGRMYTNAGMRFGFGGMSRDTMCRNMMILWCLCNGCGGSRFYWCC